MPTLLLIAAASYLLGSIPFGYLLVWIFRGEDVRQSGSGNIGATNVSRKSPVLGVLTLLLDALKGTCAVLTGESRFMRSAFPGNVDVESLSPAVPCGALRGSRPHVSRMAAISRR